MAIVPNEHAVPIDLTIANKASLDGSGSNQEAQIASYITTWRNQCRSVFIQRRNVWDECWKLYRGLDDYSKREDWQSKIVLPKSWASVKMATNAIKRLLAAAKKPWNIESVNQNDLLEQLRAEKMTDLTRVFMDKADFLKEFSDGLECGFILGLGVWKLWWGLVPRKRTRVETQMITVPYQSLSGQSPNLNAVNGDILQPEQAPQQTPPPFAQDRFGYKQQNQGMYPNQLAGSNLAPQGWGLQSGMGSIAPPTTLQIPQKHIIEEEILEGKLFIRAVDPYNFYWLPGSKLNRWVGTIEEVEIPKWELLKLAKAGVFPQDKVDAIQPRRIDERYKMSNLRFNETVMTQNGPNSDTAVCKLTEFYGPIVIDGKIVEEYAHVILANDSIVLLYQANPFLHKKAPYVGFSPLSLPFRTEGVGLIENVRHIDKALSQLANLSIDTLMFRLLPLFEVTVDAFENPEDLETGITPGKMLRKNPGSSGIQGIKPVEFQDISSGTIQVAAQLDRAHQEGSMISDISEGLPRFRGAQTATESTLLQQQSESFMGSMATDIEKQAIEPMVTMAMDLIFQFLDTANDPRVGSILGVGQEILSAMSRAEVMEMIQGDYKVKVSGISGQLQKAEMLQNLVQFMNLIGQNPQAWLPYINQDALLRRILEAFRPSIHDIEDIIADPATQEAKKLELQQEQITPDLVSMLPQLAQMKQTQDQSQQDQGLELQKLLHAQDMQKLDIQHQQVIQQVQQQHEMQMAQMQQTSQPSPQPQPNGGQ